MSKYLWNSKYDNLFPGSYLLYSSQSFWIASFVKWMKTSETSDKSNSLPLVLI